MIELGWPESPFNRCGGRKLSGCQAHEDDCAKCGRVVCSYCGAIVIPRVGSYWFLLLSPRGRCRFPGVDEMRVVLCGPCGRRCRELLESNGFDPDLIARASTGHPE